MLNLLIPLLGSIASKVVGKIAKEKGLGDIGEDVQGLARAIAGEDPEIQKEMAEFSAAWMEYFGKMSDLPPLAQTFRAMVRPVTSMMWMVGYYVLLMYGFAKGMIEFQELLVAAASFTGPIVGFYFGERSALKIPGVKNN